MVGGNLCRSDSCPKSLFKLFGAKHHACFFGSSEEKTGYRTWFWMVPPILWGLNYFVRETPAPFSSFSMIETWNPHEGYANQIMLNVCLCLCIK